MATYTEAVEHMRNGGIAILDGCKYRVDENWRRTAMLKQGTGGLFWRDMDWNEEAARSGIWSLTQSKVQEREAE